MLAASSFSSSILRHVFGDSFSSRRQKALSAEPKLAAQLSGRVRLADRIDGFTLPGRERRHVHQPDDLWIITRLGNHHAGVGMADEYDRSVLQRDDTLRRRYIVSQRGQRILNSDHMKALRLEKRNYSGPARSIRPGAVNQDNISG